VRLTSNATPLRAVVRFDARSAVVCALAIALLLATSPLTVAPVSAAEPKVAIIVGPTGTATDAYRAEGERAAAEARRYTSQVVTVFSPDATWPAARAAMQGASIVIYLGHGNGWPSRYSTTLYPKTQDGLGLNPVAGVDDEAHQYFGEAYLASSVRLAPHAVVLLSHLCYASGEAEPGLPAASLDVAEQRVDNYAAGWLRAGAEAVVSDASSDTVPYYVGAILAGSGSMEDIWRASPAFRDHVIAFPSVRTPTMTGLLDPIEAGTGFYSSLVARATLRADEVARGAIAMEPGAGGVPTAPAGPVVTGVSLGGVPVAGSTVPLVATSPAQDPQPVGLGVRWDLLALDTVAPPSSPPSSPPPTPSAGPNGGPSVQPSPTPAVVPAVALARPEVPGDVVAVAETRWSAAGLEATVEVPAQPGLYRVVVTLHDGDGVAFDRATQERVPALIVRVTRPLSATIAAPRSLVMEAGATVIVPLAVTNSGQVEWTSPDLPRPLAGPPEPAQQADPATALLVGHWLRLDAGAGTNARPGVVATVAAPPGDTVQVALELTAPLAPGDYLLVLDIVSPLHGSLTAQGMPPIAIPIRVDPVDPATPDVAPLIGR